MTTDDLSSRVDLDLVGALGLAAAILSLLCDAGERYLPTYHDAAWVQQHMGDCTAAQQRLAALTG